MDWKLCFYSRISFDNVLTQDIITKHNIVYTILFAYGAAQFYFSSSAIVSWSPWLAILKLLSASSRPHYLFVSKRLWTTPQSPKMTPYDPISLRMIQENHWWPKILPLLKDSWKHWNVYMKDASAWICRSHWIRTLPRGEIMGCIGLYFPFDFKISERLPEGNLEVSRDPKHLEAVYVYRERERHPWKKISSVSVKIKINTEAMRSLVTKCFVSRCVITKVRVRACLLSTPLFPPCT